MNGLKQYIIVIIILISWRENKTYTADVKRKRNTEIFLQASEEISPEVNKCIHKAECISKTLKQNQHTSHSRTCHNVSANNISFQHRGSFRDIHNISAKHIVRHIISNLTNTLQESKHLVPPCITLRHHTSVLYGQQLRRAIRTEVDLSLGKIRRKNCWSGSPCTTAAAIWSDGSRRDPKSGIRVRRWNFSHPIASMILLPNTCPDAADSCTCDSKPRYTFLL